MPLIYPEFHLKKTPISIFQDRNGNKLFIKEESKNPSGSIKDRVFNYGLQIMLERKLIAAGDTIEIASSGNAAISLATIAPYYGLTVKVYMPSSTSVERREIMTAMKVEAQYVAGGMAATIAAAQKEAQQPHNYYIDQFFDPLFLGAHVDTAAEIKEEIPKLDYLVSGVGTGITIHALAEKLRQYYPQLKIAAYEPEEARFLSARQFGPHGLEGVGPNFYPPNFDGIVVEKIVPINRDEAYDLTIELLKKGYNYGITTAANILAALKLEVHHQNILVINYDSAQKYLKVLNDYGQTQK